MDIPTSNNISNYDAYDPYAYLDRSAFTSEKFKIEVRGLPKFYGMKELKKLMNDKLQLKSAKIKFPHSRSSWVYVCFRSDEDREHALKILNSYKWKGSCLKAEPAKPVPDPLVQKRIQKSSNSKLQSNEIELDETKVLQKIKDATTPWWDLPYEKQLENKKRTAMKILKTYGSELVKVNPGLINWYKSQQDKCKGLPCELLPIRHAKEIDGYRNKCEFSIGYNEATREKTVGFRLGSYLTGCISVAPIDELSNVPEQMKIAVNAFQKFIRNSELDVFNPEIHLGCWQQLTVRFGFRTNQLMLVIGINSRDMSSEEIVKLKDEIKTYFTEGDGKCCNVTSLYVQLMKRKTCQEDEPIYEHLHGDTHISEQILSKTFRISPQAFFQVNTNATEILYESISELVPLTEDVTLLDVCCGTGTIGICLSDKCGEVLGLEISPEAVADAELNASYNNVHNAKFFTGKAEDVLSCVAQKATKKDIIAIVDPPRAGLQHEALVQLRRNERIKKLIYVSCDPKRAKKNFIDLSRPPSKIFRGEPFLPVKAISVDKRIFSNLDQTIPSHSQLRPSSMEGSSVSTERQKSALINYSNRNRASF